MVIIREPHPLGELRSSVRITFASIIWMISFFFFKDLHNSYILHQYCKSEKNAVYFQTQKLYNFHPSQKQTQLGPPKHRITFLEILCRKKGKKKKYASENKHKSIKPTWKSKSAVCLHLICIMIWNSLPKAYDHRWMLGCCSESVALVLCSRLQSGSVSLSAQHIIACWYFCYMQDLISYIEIRSPSMETDSKQPNFPGRLGSMYDNGAHPPEN